MTLGITVDMNVDLVKFGQQLDRATGQFDKFQAKAETMASRVNSTLAGLGVGLSVAGLASFVKSGIDAADALNDLSDRTGIAIEKLAGLEYAVKIGDTTTEAFASSIQRLSVNMGKYADDFAKLGITATDPIEAFKQLADIFSSIDDPQQRAAIGASALGKSYAEMAPLLLQGADGIQALIDKGREHNPVTAEQARLAGEFNDRLDELGNRMQHFSVIVAGPVIEALNGFGKGVEFAAQVTNGFDPLGFLEAGSFGASGKAGQLDYINRKIEDLTASVEQAKNAGAAGKLFDVLLGAGSVGEQTRELERLVKMREELQKPPITPPATLKKVDDKAVQSFIQKTGDETEKASKKMAVASKSVDAYKASIDALNKSLLVTADQLEKQRPQNLASLDQITQTPEQQAETRRKTLLQKNIALDKANKKGDTAGALQLAQDAEKLAFEKAQEDLYGVRAGELPGYKAFDAKNDYNKAISASKKALERFNASQQQPQALSLDRQAKNEQALQQSINNKDALGAQIGQAEQLKKLLDEIKNPIEIKITSNVYAQIEAVGQLEQRLADVSAQTGSATQTTAPVVKSLSTEVLKRGSRT